MMSAADPGSGLYVSIHNAVSSDQAFEMGPWFNLNWQLIHQSQFPLWNKYTLLGLPQFFNFQSAVLGLPNLISYLFPVKYGYLIINIIEMIMAGTGAYAFSRALGSRPSVAVFAGITYELSGGFASSVGWGVAGVNAWLGWLILAAYLLYRKRSYRIYIPLFSTGLAFSLYGGFPESVFLMCLAILVFVSVLFVHAIRNAQIKDFMMFFLKMTVAVMLGIFLASPLLLPGLQLASISVRSSASLDPLPAHTLINFLLQGYYGYPTSNSAWFGPINYYEITAYVGPSVCIFALVGIVSTWRKIETSALVISGIVFIMVVYQFGILQTFINAIPHLNTIGFTRARVILDFIIAMLGGIGLEDIMQSGFTISLRKYFAISSFAIGSIILYLFVKFKILGMYKLNSQEVSIRTDAFVWAAIFFLAMAIFYLWWRIGNRGSVWFLVISQATLLLFAGVGINTYGSRYYPETKGMMTLRQTVGTGLLGTMNISSIAREEYGYFPETNIAYGVKEFAGYDPMIPKIYAISWHALTGNNISRTIKSPHFTPSISSLRIAREYGIQYVIGMPYFPVFMKGNSSYIIALTLKKAGLYTKLNIYATILLLERYTLRQDLQSAFPLQTPNLIQTLLDWTKQFQLGEKTDSDWKMFTPYAHQYKVLMQYTDVHPNFGRELMRSLAVSSSFNANNLVLHETNYNLYSVSRSSEFSVEGGTSKVISVSNPNNYTWVIRVNGSGNADAETLISRLTDVPGWHATIDGKAVALRSWNDVMQQMNVPGGDHTIKIWYWPRLFTIGIVMSIFALLALIFVSTFKQKRRI